MDHQDHHKNTSSRHAPPRHTSPRKRVPRTSWDNVAPWYIGWVGEEGSKHHRNLAIPSLLELLDAQSGEKILDIGGGSGVLAPFIHRLGARYVCVDASERLLAFGRERHKDRGRFLFGDARDLRHVDGLSAESFDAVTFLLSIQDMDPLDAVIDSAAWALRDGGRIAILMTHPCFRMPRQSGWGWDERRKLQYRRIDSYLTPLAVPMKEYIGREKGTTTSYHRPLSTYINELAAHDLIVDAMQEIPTYKVSQSGPHARAENRANEEIPLFMGLRARKIARSHAS